ncbi:MAG: hypothetical protein ABEJ79_00720 [Halolamina sp.]
MLSSATTAVATLGGGAVAGLLAAAVMDVPMSRQPEGFTPAYITAAVVTRTAPSAVSFERAMVVHHVTGLLAGVLYGLVAFAAEALLTRVGVAVAVDGAAAVVAHVVGVVGVVAFVYVFFAHLVLPRAGGVVYEERATAVRGQWLRSAMVFGGAMLVAAPVVVGVADAAA